MSALYHAEVHFFNSRLQNIQIHCKYSCWKHFNKKNKLKLLTEVYQAPEKDSVTHTHSLEALLGRKVHPLYMCACTHVELKLSPLHYVLLLKDYK